MAVPKFILRILRWLNKHEVVSGFFVTMLGVWAAFWLEGLGEQRALNRTTQQRLHLAVLEAQYNSKIAKGIFRDYAVAAEPNVIRINISRLNTTAATAAFQDTNILAFVPLHKVSLLRGYVNDIDTLNQALQAHQGVLKSQGYKRTPQEKDLRKNVLDNAASVFAIALVLTEELKEYFDEKTYDTEKIEEIRKRIELIKENTLKTESP